MDDIQASTSSHFPIRRSIPCSDPGLKDPTGSLMAGITVKEETVDFDASSPDPLLLLAAQLPLPSRRRAYTRSGRSTAESSVCEVCQGELNRFDTLLQHKLLHFNTTHVCYVCDTYFVSVENLLLHMSGVHRDILGVYPKGDAFVCPICIQRFSSSKSLLRHQNLHARKEDFSCTICALDLLGCRALLTHLSSAHHKDMKVKIQSLFICIDCRSVFTSRDSYAFHMMMRAQNESCDTPLHDSHQFNPSSSSSSSDTKQLLTAPDSTPPTPHHHPHPAHPHHSSSSHQQQQRPNGDYSSRSSSQRIASEEGLRTGTFISPLNLSLAQRGPFTSGADDIGLSRRERFHQTSPCVPQRHDHDDPDMDVRIRNGTGSTTEFAGLSGMIRQTFTDSEGRSAAESKGDSGYERVMSRWCFEANLLQETATESTRPIPKSLHKRSKSAQVTDDQAATGGQSKRFRSSESAPPEVMKHGNAQQTNDAGDCRGSAFPALSPSARLNAEMKNLVEEEDDAEEEREDFRDNRSSTKSPPVVARYDGKQEYLNRGPTEIDKYRGRDGEGGGAGQEGGGGGRVGGEGGGGGERGGGEDGGNAESFPFDMCRDSFGFRGRLVPQHHHHQYHRPQPQQPPRTDKLPAGSSSSNGWESVDGSKPHFQTPRFSSGRLMPSCAMPRDAKNAANAGHCGGVGVGGLGGDHASAEDILAFVGANRDNLMMCRHCSVIYTDQIIYYLHMGLHNLNNPWQCNLCGKVCTNAQQFSSHVIHY